MEEGSKAVEVITEPSTEQPLVNKLAPSQTIYVNNLNEKLKKEGTFLMPYSINRSRAEALLIRPLQSIWTDHRHCSAKDAKHPWTGICCL